MQAYRIALALQGEPQHETRQLIGPHCRVARRLERQPGFVEGGLQYRKRLRVEGTGMKPAHRHASQRSTVIDITDLADAWDKVGRVCDGGAHLRDTGSSSPSLGRDQSREHEAAGLSLAPHDDLTHN